MFLAGAIFFMGVITAEIFYPAGYSTAQNEISDLGSTRPPDPIIHQPSATIFNTTMIVSGLLIVTAAVLLHPVFARWTVSGSILLLGVGMTGVGVFPGNNAVAHPLVALVAFVFAGLAAVLSARVTAAPFRYVAVLLGAISITFLVLAFFFSRAVFPILGDGGTERWLAYPAVLWILGFGGYMMGQGTRPVTR